MLRTERVLPSLAKRQPDLLVVLEVVNLGDFFSELVEDFRRNWSNLRVLRVRHDGGGADFVQELKKQKLRFLSKCSIFMHVMAGCTVMILYKEHSPVPSLADCLSCLASRSEG